MRPPGPLPVSVSRSTPSARATRRASGDALTRDARLASTVATRASKRAMAGSSPPRPDPPAPRNGRPSQDSVAAGGGPDLVLREQVGDHRPDRHRLAFRD